MIKKHLEVERRWLIRLPLTEAAKTAIFTEPDAPTRIVQTYLRSEDGTVKRIRHCEVDMWAAKFSHFTHTEKKLVERGINEETEDTLTEATYQTALLDRDPESITIEKTRYHIHHQGHILELDLFAGDWEGLAILEWEVKSLDQAIELPVFLAECVDREITQEDGWSNFQLSRRYSEPQDVWFGPPLYMNDPRKAPKEERSWFSKMKDWFASKCLDSSL
jgi:adenylate cyclase